MTTVLGKRLREARERLGVSQRRLGIMAGIDEASASPRVNQYETGKRNPDPSTAERLGKVLGVPTPYLYAKDDMLAAWILAFEQVGPTARRKLVRELERRFRRKSSLGRSG